jgi:hypothetical protein
MLHWLGRIEHRLMLGHADHLLALRRIDSSNLQSCVRAVKLRDLLPRWQMCSAVLTSSQKVGQAGRIGTDHTGGNMLKGNCRNLYLPTDHASL